ncbi:MAG: hypothetical protein U0872_15745 [Planctomycetaceae bacterium]
MLEKQLNRRGQTNFRWSRRQRRAARTLGILATVVGLATATWAFEETAPKTGAPGLSGIFPSEPPANLGADSFATLGGTWTEWSTGAANAVAELYQSTTGDIGAQRKALASAKAKLNVMERALGDARYAPLAASLSNLSGALSRRVDLAEAVLDTLELDGQTVYTQRLKSKADGVVSAVNSLSQSLDKISGGKAWLPFVKSEELLAALKGDPAADGAIAAAKASKEKLASRDKIENEQQKAFLNRPAFLALESALNQYLIAAENPYKPETAEQLRTQLTALVTALENYEASADAAAAAAAREAFAAVRKSSPDGGDKISAALQKHYFNFNVRIVASENLISRLMYDSHTEQGQVVDNIMGAAVSGYQTTTTTVGVDLKPSNNSAKWDLILNGTVNSNTQGVTSEATVATQGNHNFQARKEISFDGSQFKTAPGTINVNAHNTTTGLATQYSGGLFGRMADRIASQEVENRRGMSESIAASRIRDRVLPEFDREVDKAMVKAQADLQKDLFDHLRATGLYPDAMLFQTSNQYLMANTRLMAERELGADMPPTKLARIGESTIFVHETLMNNSADRIGLAGKTMTDDEFRAKLEAFFSEALNRKFTIEKPPEPAPEPGEEAADKPPGVFVFAAQDPIRIRLQDDTLSIIFRTGFKRDNGEDIPQQVITVPLSFEVQGDKIVISRGTVKVAAAEGGGAGNIATAGIIRRKIQSTIPERTVDAKFKLQGTRQEVDASVTGIKLVDGWAVVGLK